jgi:hypothetical protein
VSAAREYKEIIAEISAAVEGVRERDRHRAAALARELVGLREVMQQATERVNLVRTHAEKQWEVALDALWVESWLRLRLRPGPDPRADPAQLDRWQAELEQRRAELIDAVRRRRFGLGRR